MPYIQIETAKATKEQKEKLIAQVTQVASDILGLEKAAFFCLVKENETDNWGIGGKTLTQIQKEKQGK